MYKGWVAAWSAPRVRGWSVWLSPHVLTTWLGSACEHAYIMLVCHMSNEHILCQSRTEPTCANHLARLCLWIIYYVSMSYVKWAYSILCQSRTEPTCARHLARLCLWNCLHILCHMSSEHLQYYVKGEHLLYRPTLGSRRRWPWARACPQCWHRRHEHPPYRKNRTQSSLACLLDKLHWATTWVAPRII